MGSRMGGKQVTGATRVYALVGDPLIAARSPQLFNRLFAEQGVDAICVPFAVKADALEGFVAGARSIANLDGLLITMPHKQRMVGLVDELHPTARDVGALNVVRCHPDGRWV